MKTRLEWPRGATHVRLTTGGITLIADRYGSEVINGIEGDITFLKQECPQRFIATTGTIPNPLARTETKAGRPKIKTRKMNQEQEKQKRKYMGKGKFILSLFGTGLTAKQIAAEVVKKFPEPGMSEEEQLRRAKSYTQASKAHAKAKGIDASYAPVYPKDKTPEIAVATEVVDAPQA